MSAARRIVPVGALAALLVVVAVLLGAGGPEDHRTVRAAFAKGVNLIPGNDVRVAGRNVGRVTSVSYADGQAIVKLRIDNPSVWPLRRGTTARIAFSTTVSIAGRIVDLKLGPPTAPAIPDDGLLTRSDTITPVEFDDALAIFDREGRADLSGTIRGAAAGLKDERAPLAAAIDQTPAGLNAVADLFHELGADPGRLDVLVHSGSRTARAIAGRDAAFRDLLSSASSTFDELATRQIPLRRTLDHLPVTLQTTRATLARVDRSIDGLQPLIADLKPGARALKDTAPSAARAVDVLADVAPLASRTLRAGSEGAAAVRAFLKRATPLIGTATAVLDQSKTPLACIRPYGPDIAGFLTTWAGFSKNHDNSDHYIRALIAQTPFTTAMPLRSQDIVGTIPGVTYAFPRPPGLNAGQAWLQPQCGAGADALDPKQDPEGRR
ncbi:MAG: Mammalian cell entry related protein [Solirubrobacterales bacterium]|nr:Mammalian cell entry related protein [Solirubrobacterales bacterium]